MIILPKELEGCISGSSGNPHQFLGFHRLSDRKGSVIRVWEPSAERVDVICEDGGMRLEMQCIDSRGFFELHMPDREFPFQYSLKSFFTNAQRDWIDPYTYLPSCTNESLSQFSNGIERRPFQKLGRFQLFMVSRVASLLLSGLLPLKVSILSETLMIGPPSPYQCALLAHRDVGNCSCLVQKSGTDTNFIF